MTRIPFNIEKIKSGEYQAITRDRRKAKLLQVTKHGWNFDLGNNINRVYDPRLNGVYHHPEQPHDFDLFCIEPQPEDALGELTAFIKERIDFYNRQLQVPYPNGIHVIDMSKREEATDILNKISQLKNK